MGEFYLMIDSGIEINLAVIVERCLFGQEKLNMKSCLGVEQRKYPQLIEITNQLDVLQPVALWKEEKQKNGACS